MKVWNIEELLSDLECVVNIDSGSSDIEGITKISDFFKTRYESLGWSVQKVDNKELAGPGLIIKNTKEEAFDVLLVGHMDTVFPKGTAEKRAFRKDKAYAYGPGVADMKAGLVTIYHLVKRLSEEKQHLAICIALNGDEETGSLYSKGWLEELGRKSRFCFVFEPGRIGGAFVEKRKGCMDVKITFRGISAHAGVAPEKGCSAITELGHWLARVSELNHYEVGTSVNAGIVRGGTATNVVAEQAECYLDLRFEEVSELKKIQTALEAMQKNPFVKGVTVEIEYIGGSLPMLVNEASRKLIALVEKKGKELAIPVSWVKTGGSSDANHISALGIPTICGCGPCGTNLHSDAEYMVLSTIEERLDLLYAVIKGI